jgi:hypothetical protein
MIGPFLLAVAFLVVATFVILCGQAKQRDFEERFPPITDAEFVAKCSPGVRPEVALRVRRIISDILGVEYDRIHPSTRFNEDLAGD